MFKDLSKINSGFKKGFDLVYHSKVHCPVCREIIYANALMCSNCKTNFQKPPHNKIKEWQKIPLRITLIVSMLIGLDNRSNEYTDLAETQRIKEAVKSQYGISSTEYKLIKGLKVEHPNRLHTKQGTFAKHSRLTHQANLAKEPCFLAHTRQTP